MPVFTEDGVKGWLTDLVDYLGKAFPVISADGSTIARVPDRCWSTATANSPPYGGTRSRKPDLILLDNEICVKADNGMKPGWAVIKAFIEVTQNQHSVFATMLTNIVEKAYLMFESQPYRRYVVALAFVNKGNSPSWTLILVDPIGCHHDIRIPLHANLRYQLSRWSFIACALEVFVLLGLTIP